MKERNTATNQKKEIKLETFFQKFALGPWLLLLISLYYNRYLQVRLALCITLSTDRDGINNTRRGEIWVKGVGSWGS